MYDICLIYLKYRFSWCIPLDSYHQMIWSFFIPPFEMWHIFSKTVVHGICHVFRLKTPYRSHSKWLKVVEVWMTNGYEKSLVYSKNVFCDRKTHKFIHVYWLKNPWCYGSNNSTAFFFRVQRWVPIFIGLMPTCHVNVLGSIISHICSMYGIRLPIFTIKIN